MREEEDGRLQPEQVVPTGGTWSGLLFENAHTGLAPALTWSFTFECQDVGDSPVGVDLEWLTLPVTSWRDLAPHHAHGSVFAEPAESSVYFFEHHRFDAFDLRLHEQRGQEVRADLALRGDLDGLGLDRVEVQAWLRLEGIVVHLGDVSSPGEALQRLARFTDTTGLVLAGPPAGGTYLFRPGEPER